MEKWGPGGMNYICSTSITTVCPMGSNPSNLFILISFIYHHSL